MKIIICGAGQVGYGIAEQLSVLETERSITADILNQYLPSSKINLPAIIQNKAEKKLFKIEI